MMNTSQGKNVNNNTGKMSKSPSKKQLGNTQYIKMNNYINEMNKSQTQS